MGARERGSFQRRSGPGDDFRREFRERFRGLPPVVAVEQRPVPQGHTPERLAYVHVGRFAARTRPETSPGRGHHRGMQLRRFGRRVEVSKKPSSRPDGRYPKQVVCERKFRILRVHNK